MEKKLRETQTSKPGVRHRFRIDGPQLVVCCILALGLLGAILALLAISLPALGPSIQFLSRFGSLSQQSAYQVTLLLLLLKLCSPLLVLLCTGCCVLLCHLWRRYTDVAHEEHPLSFPPPFAAPTQLLPAEGTQPLPVTERQGEVPVLSGLPSPEVLVATYRQQLVLSRNLLKQERHSVLPERLLAHKRKQASLYAAPTDAKSEGELQTPVGGGGETVPDRPYVSLTLFGSISLILHALDGSDWNVPLRSPSKRTLLLVYLAAGRGAWVSRERILVELFGQGLPVTQERFSKPVESFQTGKKYLRADVRKVVAQANAHAGREVLPPGLDILTHDKQGEWSLASCCHVVDLNTIEVQHTLIERALAGGTLTDQVPKEVGAACEHLIAAYRGDFLQSLIAADPEVRHLPELAWAREPFNRYRRYYLQALWYLAESTRLTGMRIPARQALCYEQAASLYLTYSMASCTSTFDGKITLQRMMMSERALARSCLLYGKLGNRAQIDAAFSTYVTCMQQILGGSWEPNSALVQMVEQVKHDVSCPLLEEHVVPELGLTPLGTVVHSHEPS